MAVIPGLLIFVGLALYKISLSPTWVGDGYDDGGYFLMSRNVWRYGAPLLDSTGAAVWSPTWSPIFPLLVSPLGGLPMGAAVLGERLVVVLLGLAMLMLSYTWLRREVGLGRGWAALCLACLGSAPIMILMGTPVMSDMPAAAAVLGGIILLRRQRIILGTLCLVIAFSIRALDAVVLAAALSWLLLGGRRREALRSAIVAVLGCGAWSLIQLSHGGTVGYLGQALLRSSDHPELGRVGAADIVLRIGDNLSQILSGQLGAVLVGGFQSSTLITHFGALVVPATLLLVLLSIHGFWRRRLGLEALVSLYTLVAVLLWPWSPYRFLLPLAPFLVGTIAATLADLRRPTGTALAALAAVLTLASNLQHFVAITPSPAASRARVEQQLGAYGWIRHHTSPEDRVIDFNDIQCFLYSGHPAARGAALLPGHTYVVYDPSIPGRDPSQHPLDVYMGEIVYRTPTATILRADSLR